MTPSRFRPTTTIKTSYCTTTICVRSRQLIRWKLEAPLDWKICLHFDSILLFSIAENVALLHMNIIGTTS